MAFAATVLRCHVLLSKGSWPEERNDFESYCLGLVLTHSSESDAGVEADWGAKGNKLSTGLGLAMRSWCGQSRGKACE